MELFKLFVEAFFLFKNIFAFIGEVFKAEERICELDPFHFSSN